MLLDAGFETHIAVGDFFEYEASVTYDAVVGNPPFVRYQSFSGAIRTRSLAAALAQGVRLSGLANAWAAFVVKAALKLPRFSGHLNTVRRRCPDVENPSTLRAGVPAPNG